MAITLESVAPPGLDQEAVEEEEIVEPAETAEVAAEVEAETEDQEPTEEIATEEPPVEVPVPKARGRPKQNGFNPKGCSESCPKGCCSKTQGQNARQGCCEKACAHLRIEF